MRAGNSPSPKTALISWRLLRMANEENDEEVDRDVVVVVVSLILLLLVLSREGELAVLVW